MKILRHPIHLMLIHFPAALFPIELLCSFIWYKTGTSSFADASFYAMLAGVLFGWLAIITGSIDLLLIKDSEEIQVKALTHGTINTIVVIAYTVALCVLYNSYPNLPGATIPLLAIKTALNILMIAGNYLGGNLVLKYKIGVIPANKEPI